MSKKDLRARVDPDDYSTGSRILDRLGMSMQDALEGWWYRLIHGDEEAEAAASDYHRAKGDVEALERREERLDERIEQLEEERENVRDELEEARERLEEAEDNLVDSAAAAHVDSDSNSESELEDVAYGVLVDVAHNEVGTDGLTSGTPGVREAAVGAGVDPDDLIVKMREMARPAGEELDQYDDLVGRSFLVEDQSPQQRPGQTQFDQLREQIAEEVLDDGDVDWDEVPSPGIDF